MQVGSEPNMRQSFPLKQSKREWGRHTTLLKEKSLSFVNQGNLALFAVDQKKAWKLDEKTCRMRVSTMQASNCLQL